ncbi:mannonate dehydratase [Polaribacter vadi]|uniref:Mannonate dehydratase n=1 Tax=Polaribacter vadi TaxID=1774273 RepID=A0A1B8TS54_9FLAO|nr:mannonate dehydratase [Polaribacter vadi]AOW17726.1 mannonate dehydratase [Polaribacter vadi]OBY62450.1 mannonate dehydratase [Polaribacter vadi]
MIFMTKTMRWYGPNDKTSLINIKQCGVKGIVTALHEIPVGNVWEIEDINERKKLIEDKGLEWKVVESLPVHEDIKKRTKNYEKYIENYKKSIQNLAECGIEVITYNFMPVLDWVRTHTDYLNQDGTKSLYFHKDAFVYFDVFLLKRPNAKADYTPEEIRKALLYGQSLSRKEKSKLSRSVLLGLPGSTKNFTSTQILKLLEEYKNIDEATLRNNLILFLKEVTPIAEKASIALAIHPDDPPYSVLGLPRIVGTKADLQLILNQVPSIANGLCYCTGSLGAHPENDLLDILETTSDRIHFLHLRNVIKDIDGNFKESDHLEGDTSMEKIVEKIIKIMQTRKKSIPMRPDHGFLHSIEGKELYPGYSLIGRLKGLSEIRGLEMGINYNLTKN